MSNMATNSIPELQVRRENNRLFCPHDGCGYNGSVYWRIRDHVMSWHLDTAPWPCPASGCNEGLNTKPALEVHARAVHAGDGLERLLNLISDLRTVSQLPDRSIVVHYGNHVVPHVPVTIPGMPSTNGGQSHSRRTTVRAPAAPEPAPSAGSTPSNQLSNGEIISIDGVHPAAGADSTPSNRLPDGNTSIDGVDPALSPTPFTIFSDGHHPALSADSTPFTVFSDEHVPAPSAQPTSSNKSSNGDIYTDENGPPSLLTNGTFSDTTVSSPMSHASGQENQEYPDDQSAPPMTNGHVSDEDAAWYYEGRYTTTPPTIGSLGPSRHILAPITQDPDALSSSAHDHQLAYPEFAPTNLDSGFAPGPVEHAQPLPNGAYYDSPSQMHVQNMDHHQYINAAQYQQQAPIPGQHPSYLDSQLRQLQNALCPHLERSPLDQLQPASPFDNYRQLSFEQHLRGHREQQEQEEQAYEQNLRMFLNQNLQHANEQDQPDESQVSPTD